MDFSTQVTRKSFTGRKVNVILSLALRAVEVLADVHLPVELQPGLRVGLEVMPLIGCWSGGFALIS